MLGKDIKEYSEIIEEIIEAVDILADPVVGTLSPMGANVLIEDSNGNIVSTNDGATIARHISVKNPRQNAIIETIKSASFKTNGVAGDGTTTTILLSQSGIKSGLKLRGEGWNPIKLKKEFEKFSTSITEELSKNVLKIKSDKDLFSIATISSNNDEVIAKDVVRIVKVVGEDGMVFLEPNNKKDTEIIEDVGFHIKGGFISPELKTSKTNFSAIYENVPALITDKRLYYAEEAETIIRTAIEAGHKSLVIIARDFIGKSLDFFLANHTQGVINLLLIKDPSCTEKDNESTQDLAIYLGGKMVTEKAGKIVNKMTKDDFCYIGKIYSDQLKTIITPKKGKNKELEMRIEALKKESEKDKEDKVIKRRLSSLTNGMVTVKIGGSTPIEAQERMFRYEDAVNAVRTAIKDGYLVGGGMALLRAFKNAEYHPDLKNVFKKFCESSIRQIAKNCGKHPETVIEKIMESTNPNFGYNALTDKYEDLLKAGVIDPFKVTEMAVQNSISVTNAIISSNYLIVSGVDDSENKDNK